MNAIGHSLLEEMVYKDGQLLNPNLVDYRVPTFAHCPKISKRFWSKIETAPDPSAPRAPARALIAGASASATRFASDGAAAVRFAAHAREVWRALGKIS